MALTGESMATLFVVYVKMSSILSRNHQCLNRMSGSMNEWMNEWMFNNTPAQKSRMRWLV